MHASKDCIALIREFEGFRGTAYLDPVGIPTIGYGFTKGVTLGDTITREAADKRLAHELASYERGVDEATKGKATQAQFDALVSFAYNVGVAGMKRSSVIKAHNRGDYQAAARAFALWNKAGGRVLPGLTRRRAAEAALYLRADVKEFQQALTVEPESKMAASPINRASVVAGGTAGLAAVAETARAVSDVKQSLESLGVWLIPLLLIVVVGLCGYVIWQRVHQRKEGWA